MIRGLSPIPRGGGKPGVSAPRSVLSSLTLSSGTSRGTPTGRRGSVLPRSGRFAYKAECFGMLRGTRYTRSAELPLGSFLVTQCSAPRERGCYFFIACPVRRAARACDKKAECFGMLRGTRYARSAELPWAPFWRLNAAHLVNEAVIFLSRALCGEPRGRAIKKHPRSSRGCAALAGAIGIEPTPWESEAHVLPLHPTRE